MVFPFPVMQTMYSSGVFWCILIHNILVQMVSIIYRFFSKSIKFNSHQISPAIVIINVFRILAFLKMNTAICSLFRSIVWANQEGYVIIQNI